jgi:glycosyltransferase involved in cell wall biosynthesis
MPKPSISIVTPSFNQGKYLEETIRSVLDQGYENLQYIIIDGGSTDESVDIIKKYQDRLSYWTSERDKGQTDALNKGVARCTGEIFGYINSDDLLMPGSLDRVAQTWEGGARWIVGWSKYLELGGSDWPYMVRHHFRKADWFLDNPIPQQSSFWARAFFDQVGTFRQDLHYCFDYEYWMRLRFQADIRPEGTRKCLSAFRLHGDSKTVTVWTKFEKEFDLIRSEYVKYLSLKDRWQWWRGRRESDASAARKRMWRALHDRDVKSARREAITSMQEQPLSFESWKSLYIALRGH